MELRVFTEPQQGATYDDLLAVAQVAERAGFGAFFRSDHYLKMGGVSGLPGPTDAWVTLAGIARETTTIKLGTLVTSATFRHPGPLAVSVAQVQQMSGGRVELGLGAGWYEAEHAAFAIPFPSLGERFERFEEQLAIITGMWAQTTTPETPFNFSGKHYTVAGAPGLPKPPSLVPIVIGGGGAKRTPRLAAAYASEFNTPFQPANRVAELYANVRKACEAINRDPASMTMSSALLMVCGTTTGDIERRAASIGRDVEELRVNALCGTPAEIVEQLAAFSAVGTERLYVQILDLADLEHVQLIGEQVLPAAASL
jgi:F420-dependent oxidoreductase-like protein